MTENKPMRADTYLHFTGHTKSRQSAKELIEAGFVEIDGRRVVKPSEMVDAALPHSVGILQKERYVSRGGHKLEAALDYFKIDVTGMTAVDIGASTGGFTDCLLQRGAARVFAPTRAAVSCRVAFSRRAGCGLKIQCPPAARRRRPPTRHKGRHCYK